MLIKGKTAGRCRQIVLNGAAFAICSLLSVPAIAMDQSKGNTVVHAGTVTEPNWYEGSDTNEGDFGYHLRHFTYMTDQGPVVGLTASLMFTLDAPSSVVWEYMKDFNTFEGPFGIHYTGVWGEMYNSEEQALGKQTLQYQATNGEWSSVPSEVIRVIPQHQLTLYETIPADGSSGGISPGFHTVLFNDHGGKTTVTTIFEHAERLPKGTTEEQALNQSMWGPKKYDHAASTNRWKDDFVPLLRKLVAGKGEKK